MRSSRAVRASGCHCKRRNSPELEFLKSLWGLGTGEEEGYRTGPPGYIGWRNSFLGIDSGAPYTFKNTGSGFDSSILRHSGIWGVADEALLIDVHEKEKRRKKFPFNNQENSEKKHRHIQYLYWKFVRKKKHAGICFSRVCINAFAFCFNIYYTEHTTSILYRNVSF